MVTTKNNNFVIYSIMLTSGFLKKVKNKSLLRFWKMDILKMSKKENFKNTFPTP